ncbi:nitrogenase cofactor biosynthesis protein NifB [Orenia marismortui]|uniref:FeMo cofactor biosynthesis protein NifB n=1 Tax=Orenia marismortui TaxID=46469 RepID=A0A4V3GYH0_9FIRM|nr:nitrogenase cofactor biosynthesis protein NifB [Orenia marismortui]TDX52705.1 nitrogen fixation protein NifB [Orenia marismortui]
MSNCSVDLNLNFPEETTMDTILKTAKHPCYSECAHDYARMHIPVAPRCNISCNYCNRRYDCLHESRPGVTSEVLTPEGAYKKYLLVKDKLPNLKVIGIAGPGDALANFEETKEAIKLIKEDDPELTICISTNGLMLPEYAQELVELGVRHVTITINAIDPKIGALIYKWFHYQGKVLSGEEGAKILLDNQLEGLKFLSSKGVLCKVNIVMIKGLNDHHIPEVVNKVKEHGAFMTNIMPLIPAEGSEFEEMPLVSNKELNELRDRCSLDLKQMYHCKQCRADAIGQLSQDISIEFRGTKTDQGDENKSLVDEIKSSDLLFAIASKTGRLIDQHFGHVDNFLVYKYTDQGIALVDNRSIERYCIGKECEDKEAKIKNIVDLLSDCEAVLSMRIGYEPKKKLLENGIKSLEIYDGIEDGIEYAIKELGLKDVG